MERGELIRLYEQLPDEEDADETMDDEALVAGILKASLEQQEDSEICTCVQRYWADFDLYSETQRFKAASRENYRSWLDQVISGNEDSGVPDELRASLIEALVATTINYERRAKVFREVHPLALQVILSTGVLNGILVARTVDQCAAVLEGIIGNRLDLESKEGR